MNAIFHTPEKTSRRATPLKKAILELLKTNHFLSASQIVELLHQQHLTTHKTSVYRNLELFLQEDVICRQAFGDEVVYELQTQHHDHINCTQCGKVEKIACATETPRRIHGFVVKHHHLTLYGVCKTCRG